MLERRPSVPSRPARPARLATVIVAAGLVAAGCSSTKSAGTSPTACPSSTPPALSPACDTSGPAVTLNGAGASSASPFFTTAFYTYRFSNRGVKVNYNPAGSSVGVSDIQQNTVQFGDSEIPIPAPASGTAGTILQLPVDLGGVALAYNVTGVGAGLKLDGPTLAGIFLGTIKTWNDMAITGLNPGMSLPGTPIVAVHRADSSGPGYDLDQYLIDAGGSAWTDKIQTTKASTHWPVAEIGVGQQLNTGVAGYIQQTSGAIGYVEQAYAAEAHITSAALKNASGAFVTPSPASIAAAGAQASGLSATNFTIVNGPGADTYPLANFSWTLLYQKQADAETGIALGKLFDWVTTTGQQQATSTGYTPLPANAVALAHSTLQQLENASGQPLFS
ncbi:MAG TPA: phosphate ABC transporter substrate-binding protein PstS [Actinomycetota bacterium]|nr:phosphate ABC transporter substrate-binding protein PstS [Actinomycetota bacterium]